MAIPQGDELSADTPGGLRLALVAGEASGDLLAGLLLDGLRQRWPGLRAMGIGGPQLAARGFDAWWPHEKLAVRGYVEVLRHYREIVGIRRRLRERLLGAPPDLFVGVDAPDFNLDLEHSLRQAGVPCVHFVCPSVWAWRPQRLARMREAVDHVLCIFPFEPELLQANGIGATYVGHPLASVIPEVVDQARARAGLGLAPGAPVLAILPGSRASEVQYLAGRFFEAQARLQRERPHLQCITPAVPSLRATIEAHARRAGVLERLRIVEGRSHEVLAACDVALVASGTATLEAALFQRPMVIAYNMHPLTWQIMRRKRLQPWVGLPNILCREFVVPELLQDAASPQALADEVRRWLDDGDAARRVSRRFAALHQSLRRDTPRLATDAIAKLLGA